MKSKSPRTPSKNNSAFSILEVMVVAGLMSIVGLSITSVVTNSTKSQKRIELKDGQVSTTNQIRNVLQNAAFCANAFCTGGATCAGTLAPNNTLTLTGLPQAGPVAANFKIDLQGIQVFSGQTAAQNIASCTTDCGNGSADEQPPDAGPYGTPVGNTGLYIYKMRLINFTYQGTIGGNHVSLADLQIRFTRDPKRTIGGQFQDSVIKLVISATSGGPNAGRIVGCTTGAGDSLWQESTTNVNDIFFNSGEVGIGVINPLFPLHVVAGASQVVVQTESAGPDTQISLNNTTAAGKNWKIGVAGTGSGTTGSSFYIQNLTDALIPISVLASGNVGIGTETPRSRMDINGAVRLKAGAPANDTAAIGLGFEDNGDTGLFMTNWAGPATGDLNLYTNAVPQLTVTSAGNVGIGSAGPGAKLDVAGNILLSGAATRSLSTEAGNSLRFNASGASSLFLMTQGIDRLSIAPGGTATFSSNVTVSNGGIAVTGNSSINGTFSASGAVTASSTLAVTGALSTASNLTVGGTATLPTIAGNIQHNGNLRGNTGTITNYSLYQVSDRTLKRNITAIPEQTDFLEQLGIYNFTYISDPKNKKHFGLIAQEVQKFYPELVMKTEDGKLNVNYIELIPILIKALQETNAEIAQLKNQNAKFEFENERLVRLTEQFDARQKQFENEIRSLIQTQKK